MSNARNLARLLPDASGQLPDAAMASGSVLQVVQAVNQTGFNTTGSALCVSATITPISTTSKILVIAQVSFLVTPSANAWAFAYVNRNGGNIWSGGGSINSGIMHEQSLPLTYLDSPNSTSPVIYDVGFGKGSGGTASIDHERSSVILLEVAA